LGGGVDGHAGKDEEQVKNDKPSRHQRAESRGFTLTSMAERGWRGLRVVSHAPWEWGIKKLPFEGEEGNGKAHVRGEARSREQEKKKREKEGKKGKRVVVCRIEIGEKKRWERKKNLRERRVSKKGKKIEMGGGESGLLEKLGRLGPLKPLRNIHAYRPCPPAAKTRL